MHGRRESVHHTQFDSFVQAKAEARSFIVNIHTRTGVGLTSSPIPISEFDAVSAQIQEALETQMPVTIWNRQERAVKACPAANVGHVWFTFNS